MTPLVRFVVFAPLAAALIALVGCPQRGQQPVAPAGQSAVTSGGTPAASGPGGERPSPATGRDTGPGAELAAKQAAIKSYIMTMVIDGKPMGKQYLKYEKGQAVRIKSVMSADDPSGGYMLFMTDKKVNYIVNPREKTAIKISGGEAEAPGVAGPGTGESPPVPDLKDLEAQAPQWATETVDGEECWKVEMSAGAVGASGVWIDKKYGLPRQMKAGNKLIKYKYDKINAVPDSEFELPPGTKVTEGMPGMPKMPGG